MTRGNWLELRNNWIAIAVTSAAVTAAFIYYYYAAFVFDGGSRHATSDLIFLFVAAPLIYGSLVYQATRLGELKRNSVHRRAKQYELERVYGQAASPLAILIPSYKEEPQILRQTVLSAALVEYPGRRVVVLIDDPIDDQASRTASWNVIRELKQMLAEPARHLEAERDAFHKRQARGATDPHAEVKRLAKLYNELAGWFESQAADWATDDSCGLSHVNTFFADNILLAPAAAHRRRAAALLAKPIEAAEIEREYVRLAQILTAEISGFERKAYANLSHLPNKAMNLNAYIGLLGGSFRFLKCPGGTVLVRCDRAHADLHVPGAEFLLTLDADSVVLSDYALRLANVLQSDARIAVAQTPYSAFPGASTLLERTAGATTDIQYIAHQGSSYFDAAYWVGANALLRVAALQDIKTTARERGHIVPVFIQDRTVIEDTGSTIDLIRKGWKIHNYPERLAYSATPPDFGSLVIQRRRWANGGLIVLPDLIRLWLSNRPLGATGAEALVRMHYLVSPAAGSIGVLAILLYPFDSIFSTVWLPLAAAPYYYLYGRDLIRSGYGWSDLPRVYALNLLLLPVNLAGVLLSLRQAATGRKSSFGRTPKVEDRTAVPMLYSGFNTLMLAVMVAAAAYAIVSGSYARVPFPLINGAVYAYGLVALMGLRESWSDAKAALRRRPTRSRALKMPVRQNMIGGKRTAPADRITKPVAAGR